jgi:hypothetical protein
MARGPEAARKHLSTGNISICKIYYHPPTTSNSYRGMTIAIFREIASLAQIKPQRTEH